MDQLIPVVLQTPSYSFNGMVFTTPRRVIGESLVITEPPRAARVRLHCLGSPVKPIKISVWGIIDLHIRRYIRLKTMVRLSILSVGPSTQLDEPIIS